MKVLIAGDYCPRERVAQIIEEGDYAKVFSEVKSVTEKEDYSIVNFECPVVKGNSKPIEKNGPNLKCSPRGIESIKWAGFNCVTLANNHFRDFGEEGVRHTLEDCIQLGIDTVGGGKKLEEAANILYKIIGDKKLAIINCCENEFSIATENYGGSNPLNPISQYYAIKEAKTKADFVLVVVHGGHEHFQYPSLRMVETYRFFIDAGADTVVNHHQHCFSGFETYKGKPIFYGLGNFCFDNNKKGKTIWNYGYMVELEFKDEIHFTIIPYEQCSEHPKVNLLNRNVFDKTISEINDKIADLKKLHEVQDHYYNESQYNLKVGLMPVSSKLLRSLLFRNIIHPLLPKQWLLRLENYSMCESHRDKLKYLFDKEKEMNV